MADVNHINDTSLSSPAASTSCPSRCLAGLRKALPRLILITGYVIYLVMGGVIFSLIEQPVYNKLVREHLDIGLDNQTAVDHVGIPWTIGNSMLFCMTTISTIGYGHAIPRTAIGKVLLCVYTMFGIPLTILIIGDLGRLYAILIMKFVNRCSSRCCKSRKKLTSRRNKAQRMKEDDAPNKTDSNGLDTDVKNDQELNLNEASINDNDDHGKVGEVEGMNGGAQSPLKENGGQDFAAKGGDDDGEHDDDYDVLADVPIFLPPLIFWSYIVTSAPMLCWIEGWSFSESMYFLFITITTIGFGDIVPRSSMGLVSSWFGLIVTAMCVALSYKKVLCASRWVLAVLETKINPPRNTVHYSNI